jgi:excisionase family DNA binding protein
MTVARMSGKQIGSLLRRGDRGRIMEAILLTQTQVAAVLNVSGRTLRKWTRAGRMPQPVRIKAVVRYQDSAIREWVAAGCLVPGGWRPTGAQRNG